MPETPTPGVNGHVLSAAALHASMSMLSLAPAATTFGCIGSMATAGSFCLFCENGPVGLPAVTRLSPPVCAVVVPVVAARTRTSTANAVTDRASRREDMRAIAPFLSSPGPHREDGATLDRLRTRVVGDTSGEPDTVDVEGRSADWDADVVRS